MQRPGRRLDSQASCLHRALGRTDPPRARSADAEQLASFGQWLLDIPRVSTIYPFNFPCDFLSFGVEHGVESSTGEVLWFADVFLAPLIMDGPVKAGPVCTLEGGGRHIRVECDVYEALV